MRVLVVDQDSASNEAIARSLRDLYTVDAVTNKGDCLDLLRSNTFEVIVATERLEDGSGLELLGTVAKKWPSVLRIFAADRQRLQLLKGRLGPFELFQTLTYPIDPDRLIATLNLAGAAQDANADTSNIQHVVLSGEPLPEASEETEQPAESGESGEFPAPQPRTAASMERSQPAPRVTRSAVRGGVACDARAIPQGLPRPDDERADARAGGGPSHRVRSIPGQRPRGNGAAGPPTTRVAAGPSAVRGAAPSPSLTSEGSRPLRHSRTRTNRPPPVRFPPLERSPPLEPPQGSSAGRPGASQPDSFAEAAAMARAARSNLESPPEEFDTKRLAMMVGGGAAVVVAVLVLGFKLFGSKSEAPRPAAPPAVQAPQYSQEVGDLVAQTEAAFKADDFKGARANVDKLRQIAPSHPRLAFFDGLLVQHSDASKGSGSAAASGHGTSKRGGQSSRRSGSNATPDEKANVTAATAGSTSAPTSTSTYPASTSAASTSRTSSSSNSPSRPSAASGSAASPSIAAGQPASTRDSTSIASARSASGTDSTSTSAAGDSLTSQTPGLAPETPPGLTRSSTAAAATAPARDADALAPGSTANAAGATGPGSATTGAARVSAAATAAGGTGGPTTATATASVATGSTPVTASVAAAGSTPATASVAAAGSARATTSAAAAGSASPTASAPAAPPADDAPPAPTHVASRRASSGEPPPVIREAKLIRRVVPDYPSAAKRDGIEGSVDLEVTISSRGVVEDVSVVRATPPDMFEKSAVAAVRKWKYDPRFVDGLPTEDRITVHLDFGPGK